MIVSRAIGETASRFAYTEESGVQLPHRPLKWCSSKMTTHRGREFLDVDPRNLRLPWGRRRGADPIKLTRQISLFGTSTVGMPVILVTRDRNGLLGINNGATRATRVAKLLPGQTVRVEVLETRPAYDFSRLPT